MLLLVELMSFRILFSSSLTSERNSLELFSLFLGSVSPVVPAWTRPGLDLARPGLVSARPGHLQVGCLGLGDRLPWTVRSRDDIPMAPSASLLPRDSFVLGAEIWLELDTY